MFTTLFSLLAFIHIVFAAQSGLIIDTPSLVQCQPTQITWTETVSPYDLLVVHADDMCGEAIEDLGNQTCTAVTWTVNIAAGTQVVLSLLDGAGNEAWSGSITVANSSDASCLNTTTAASGASSAPASVVPATLLSVPPYAGAMSTASSAPPSSSSFAPAGAANAGLGTASGALSTRPLTAFTLLSSATLAAVAFIF